MAIDFFPLLFGLPPAGDSSRHHESSISQNEFLKIFGHARNSPALIKIMSVGDIMEKPEKQKGK